MAAVSQHAWASEHEDRVDHYYRRATEEFYVPHWNEEHIHFGLFEPTDAVDLNAGLETSMKDAVRLPVERMVDAVVGPAKITASALVVDAGCGIGGTALHVAKAHGCEVVGINICAHQIEIAQRRAAGAGLSDRVRFQRADCSAHLPFPDRSVDVIINIESACHYSDRARFLSECARILKDGGRIVAQDWMAADGMAEHRYREHIQPICDSWVMKSLESEASYRRMLGAAGLEVEQFVDFGEEGLGNARIMDLRCRQYAELASRVELPPARKMWFEQFRSLSSAWLAGWFRLQRYVAKKK